jgi:hypothetical protein
MLDCDWSSDVCSSDLREQCAHDTLAYKIGKQINSYADFGLLRSSRELKCLSKGRLDQDLAWKFSRHPKWSAPIT